MTRDIRILFLSANPEGTTKLKVIQECNLIDAKIQASEFRDQFDFKQSHAVSIIELQTLLLRFKPYILHFSGHGSESGALVFENYDGLPEEAPPKALSTLFKIINEAASAEGLQNNTIRCVVLNACYSIKQAKAIAQHVDCVIGISNAIKDDSATDFAASFYQALGFGKSIQTAFDLGRIQLGLAGDADESILKLEHKEDVNPSKIFLANAKSIPHIDDASVQNPEDAKRAKNLSSHCTQLLTKAPLEENYPALPTVQIIADSPSIKSQYWRQLLEHISTGHRELYEATLEFRKCMHSRDFEMESIKESISTIFQEMPAPVPNDYKLHSMAIAITGNLDKDKWEKFTWKKNDGQYELEWENQSWRIEDMDDELAERVCSALNDFFFARNQLMAFYQGREKLRAAEKHYFKTVQGFITLLNTGTTSLGGACENCLSSNFHDEKTINKYRPILAKFREEWGTS